MPMSNAPVPCGLLAALGLHAETGAAAWLRYAPLADGARDQYRQSLPAAITAFAIPR